MQKILQVVNDMSEIAEYEMKSSKLNFLWKQLENS